MSGASARSRSCAWKWSIGPAGVAITTSARVRAAMSMAGPSAAPASAEERAQHAANDLAADGRADGACGALRHRLDHAVLAAAARHQSAERPLERIEEAAACARGAGRGR